ncbi:conserved membrane hypothetical protein [Bradyrhizobium sp. STM 3843]|uniref:MAPEG family protein n=1 Tax=Bradyrhizobium sp. STM 3843 TaxID=551947 RepID=UPI00024076B2|nr:MAPEG family protein [Bradyrhizobium sp. STM 3843]CCE06998.1 conserved membrane hypothetical protein [Bradyrhizobium sp. STM 3843]
MSLTMVLLPVFVEVGLTFALLFWTRGRTRPADAGDEFGLPTLFYALIALALPLRHADLVIVLLSWVFVVTRFVHAGLVSGTKDGGRQRSLAWVASALVLLAMWLYFALKILLLI